jgi:hypothetical protein
MQSAASGGGFMSVSRATQMKVLRPLVVERAGGRCESGDRCPFPPTELHHVLPRSRARRGQSHLLDEWATVEVLAGRVPDMPWLALVCDRCHNLAHGNPKWAASIGLLVDGSVSAKTGTPVYQGTFGPLLDLFGQEAA